MKKDSMINKIFNTITAMIIGLLIIGVCTTYLSDYLTDINWFGDFVITLQYGGEEIVKKYWGGRDIIGTIGEYFFFL